MSSVAKVIEIKSSSKKSFEDAVENGIKQASKSLKNVKGAWIAEQEVSVEDGKVDEYRVLMRVTFILDYFKLLKKILALIFSV